MRALKLNYPMKSNGMYILKSGDFDDIATAILKEHMPYALEYPRAVDIDHLAQECFYLDIQHQHICYDGSILGLIAFDDATIPMLDMMYRPSTCHIPAGTIVIDYSLIGRDNLPRERFTKAHETGHWVCHRPYHSPDNQQFELRTAKANSYIACRTESIERSRYNREKTDSDWEEWQADHFAAAILMPRSTFKEYASSVIRHVGICRGFLVEGEDRKNKVYQVVEDVAEQFCVSKQAAQIRMTQLGLFVDRDLYRASFAMYY